MPSRRGSRPGRARRSASATGSSGEAETTAFHAGQRIGDFTLARLLGSGGMGEVWEALQTSMRRRVALKLVLPIRLNARSLELFVREAPRRRTG